MLRRVSLVAGFALSLVGSLVLLSGSLATFAVLYSFGVVISLVGTGFLVSLRLLKWTRCVAMC